MAGKRKSRVTDEQIVEAYQRLKSGPRAAQELGITAVTLYSALRKGGVEMYKASRRNNDVTDEQIIECYRRLKAGKKVSEELGVTEKTIYDALQKHGISRTGHAEFVERLRKFDASDKSRLVKEYLTGKAAAVLARENGCSTATLLDVLREANISLRDQKFPLGADEKQKAVEFYKSGLTLKKTAEAIGRTEATIIRFLKKEYPQIMRSDMVGPGSPHWRGGRNISHGYAYVWVDPSDEFSDMAVGKTRYVLEHRFAMARKLGRAILPTETVHHINGDHLDNRPENLQLRQGRHGKHVVMYCMACGSTHIGHKKIEGGD